jgi:hypothetical protein
MVSLAARPSEWRDQIQSIISETERNLGMKARVAAQRPPLMGALARLPPSGILGSSSLGMSSSLGAAAAMSTAPPPAPIPTGAATMQQPQAHPAGIEPPLQGSVFREGESGSKRLLESVKFELDVRGSLAEKQLASVREEMNASVTATEKKWLDIARGVETSVEARLEAEAKLRTLAEEKIAHLRDAQAQAHQETVRMVGDMQQTAIDHSVVLRRLDADLTAFRSTSEVRPAPPLPSPRLPSPRLASTRLAAPRLSSPLLSSPFLSSPLLSSPLLSSPLLSSPPTPLLPFATWQARVAEESLKLTRALDAQRELTQKLQSADADGPAQQQAAVTETRLAEVEHALLAERAFRMQARLDLT